MSWCGNFFYIFIDICVARMIIEVSIQAEIIEMRAKYSWRMQSSSWEIEVII